LADTFTGYIRTKDREKIWEKRERGRTQGRPKFSEYSLIPGSGKAMNFKFGTYIKGVHPNKSSLKMLEKRERGGIQGLRKFFQYPLLSQERAKLRS